MITSISDFLLGIMIGGGGTVVAIMLYFLIKTSIVASVREDTVKSDLRRNKHDEEFKQLIVGALEEYNKKKEETKKD